MEFCSTFFIVFSRPCQTPGAAGKKRLFSRQKSPYLALFKLISGVF